MQKKIYNEMKDTPGFRKDEGFYFRVLKDEFFQKKVGYDEKHFVN